MREFFENIKEKILGAVSKINDSYEFKPALSEIEDSPVSPLGRFTFWTIVFLIITTVLWLTLGQIDIVASARGIVIPDGEAKIIQPLETGVIEEILIKEGDFVKKGQILIKLDSSASDVKLHSIERNLKQSRIEALRLKATASGNGLLTKESDNNEDEVITVQQELYEQESKLFKSLMQARKMQIEEANNEIKSLEAQKRDYCFQLQNALDRQRRMKKVIDIIAYNEYQDICDKVNNLKENVSRLNSEILKAKARKAELVAQMTQSEAEFKTQKFENLAQKHKEIKELEANKEQIDFSNKKQRITAPCDGYIDKLMVHTTGGIVTPAQELIALTPVEQPLIIKAQVLNRDVGFIKPGMNVSIKIDTFDFQKYGILNGTLKSISKNSIEDEKLGPVYEVYIQPDTKTFKIDGREEKIATGMTLNAEINIGKRRIIEFFIYPLIKYLDEGMSVR